MHVVMLAWEYPPYIIGGLGSHMAGLVPALDRAGIHVTVITPGWGGGAAEETLPGGSRILRVRPPVPELVEFLRDVEACNIALQAAGEELGRSEMVDLVHAHDWMVGAAAIGLKHTLRQPLVATIHATERGRTGGGLYNATNVTVNGNEWWLTYEAWRVIATTHYMADQTTDMFQTPWDKLDIIPNGVDTAPFDGLPARGSAEMMDWRRTFAADDELLVYHVGRLVGEKGAPLLVDCAPLVFAQVPQAKFIVAGKGPLLDELRARTHAMGIAGRFYFTGFVPDDVRDRLYRVSDVAVFPSLYEPFGIVALEGMAARVPVVVARTGGLAEVVEHNETGIHVHPDDPESLAWGIVHTLRHPDWSAARVANAYARLKTVYDWDLIAASTVGVYGRVNGERRQSDW